MESLSRWIWCGSLLIAGCASPVAPVVTPLPPLELASVGTPWTGGERIVLPATVPGDLPFCVEDPSWNWEAPGEVQRHDGLKCVLTVNEVRAWIARMLAARR